jgi:Homocysteine S-methyltransferase
MGTMLFEAGLTSGDSPERWNVERPDVIRGVHRAYGDAGSRILLTNTFGGNRFRLALHGLDTRVGELNEAAARLAGEAAHAPGSTAVVAGDIGPSGGILAPLGELERADAVKGFAEQAAALDAGGVDVFWIETMSALEEVEAALEGVRQVAPGVPVVITMSFDTHGHTMMGVSPDRRQLRSGAGGAPARDDRDARGGAGRGARRQAERGPARAGGRESRLPREPRGDGRLRTSSHGGRRAHRRRLLRQLARTPPGDGSGAEGHPSGLPARAMNRLSMTGNVERVA